ncbi:endoribonuclease L-PSP family protein [Collimonas fungivorans]|jgi:enamine deaminase RidA (YjgF/YER057c/UK114 family)|uniref:Endoribonuclease L-PSP family protein n=1 Tax=Collimonas fungivorans TaxID=158899 RepID=A0A127PD23_9BURK|nr:RidA family protein [Collimonas fungivorans]AMO95351.1 endoribonuclease L-PSP family protein [Collimonas fungivorans]
MTFRAVNPPGPTIPGISQATIIESGKLLLLSGHVPFRPDGSVAGPGLEIQLEQVFSNLEATLRAAGSSFGNVARLTIYVCDFHPGLLPLIRSVRDRFVDTAHPPASSLIGVAALFHPDVLVEIDAIATVSA